jgi:O-antigen/teichoic acid export membrane protein
VQREEVKQQHLSSIFWLSIIVGLFFGALCFVFAYPTAWIFCEPRVIPVTRMISVLFVVGSVMIVPSSLLVRRCEFRALGRITLFAALISSISMLAMAKAGLGVYSLIGGSIILRFARVVLTWRQARWSPDRHFSFDDTRPYLRFGIHIAVSNSMSTIASSLDKFIVGRLFSAGQLGLYSYAQSLAAAPTDKIVSVIQQVSFPVLSRCQSDGETSRLLYLRIVDYTAKVMAPIYGCAFVYGDAIVAVLLGAKWMPIVPMFKLMCIGLLMAALSTINNAIHSAQGRSAWALGYTIVNSVSILALVYLAAHAGFEYLGLPWAVVYPSLGLVWTVLTARKLELPITVYLSTVTKALLPTAVMLLGMEGMWDIAVRVGLARASDVLELSLRLCGGMLLYVSYVFVFEKRTRNDLAKLWSELRQ